MTMMAPKINTGLDFDDASYGTPNPIWTKQKVAWKGSMNDLADHIVRRSPPYSFQSKTEIFISMVQRNQKALGNWSDGYMALTDMVYDRLITRDGALAKEEII